MTRTRRIRFAGEEEKSISFDSVSEFVEEVLGHKLTAPQREMLDALSPNIMQNLDRNRAANAVNAINRGLRADLRRHFHGCNWPEFVAVARRLSAEANFDVIANMWRVTVPGDQPYYISEDTVMEFPEFSELSANGRPASDRSPDREDLRRYFQQRDWGHFVATARRLNAAVAWSPPDNAFRIDVPGMTPFLITYNSVWVSPALRELVDLYGNGGPAVHQADPEREPFAYAAPYGRAIRHVEACEAALDSDLSVRRTAAGTIEVNDGGALSDETGSGSMTWLER